MNKKYIAFLCAFIAMCIGFSTVAYGESEYETPKIPLNRTTSQTADSTEEGSTGSAGEFEAPTVPIEDSSTAEESSESEESSAVEESTFEEESSKTENSSASGDFETPTVPLDDNKTSITQKTQESTAAPSSSTTLPTSGTDSAAAIAPVTKTKLTLKKVTVKNNAKKLVLQATLNVNGKAVKGKKITFVFNGKKYNAKTNKKGIAKVTIKKSVLKKLKKGQKLTYKAAYGKTTAKRTVKVK